MKEITQEYLKEALDYDPETGIFMWKERPREHFKTESSMKGWNTRYSCTNAVRKHSEGYIVISIKKRPYYAHRLAWLYVNGIMPNDEIDHINGVRDDNRISNLRDVSRTGNAQNVTKKRCGCKNYPIGVQFYKPLNKYVAKISFNKKQKHIGYFSSITEAHQAYLKAKRELHKYCVI